MNQLTQVISMAVLGAFLVGCQCEEVSLLSEGNGTQKERVQSSHTTPEVSAKEGISQAELLHRLGLYVDNNRIVIDLNQTNRFFKDLEAEVHQKQVSLEHAIDEINITKEAGILVEQGKVAVDLNRTKNLLDNISHIFKTILFDQNSTQH